MNPVMNPVGSNAEEKFDCINAVVITQIRTLILIQCIGISVLTFFTPAVIAPLAIMAFAASFTRKPNKAPPR